MTGGAEAPSRQQTLRATVDWSYSLLNGSEQSLLRRLSVFAESFDLEAAEEVCCLQDIEEIDVDDLLGSLVDKSLVVTEPSGGKARYRLLETIRQFAAQRLVERTRSRPPRSARHTPRTTCRSPNSPHRTSSDENRAGGTTGSMPTRRTCNARSSTLRPNATGPSERSASERRCSATGGCVGGETRKRSGFSAAVLDRPEARAEPKLFAEALVTVRVCLQRYQNGTVDR